MSEKLKEADKGDMLDFKLDGGMSSQVFEGLIIPLLTRDGKR